MNAPGHPSASEGWPESATIVVSCLLGVLAALVAVLVLADEGAPDTPRSVDGPNVVGTRVQSFDWAEVVEVHPGNLLNV